MPRNMLPQHGSSNDALVALPQAFFAEPQSVLETPWAMAAIPDFIFAQTKGLRPPQLTRDLRFAFGMKRLAARKPDVHWSVVEVQHLSKPRNALRNLLMQARVILELARARP